MSEQPTYLHPFRDTLVGWFIVWPISAVVTSFLARWIWNMVVPDVLHGPAIGLVDALGICLLADFFTWRDNGHPQTIGNAIVASVARKVGFALLFLAYAAIR